VRPISGRTDLESAGNTARLQQLIKRLIALVTYAKARFFDFLQRSYLVPMLMKRRLGVSSATRLEECDNPAGMDESGEPPQRGGRFAPVQADGPGDDYVEYFLENECMEVGDNEPCPIALRGGCCTLLGHFDGLGRRIHPHHQARRTDYFSNQQRRFTKATPEIEYVHSALDARRPQGALVGIAQEYGPASEAPAFRVENVLGYGWSKSRGIA
jgi:hypothetical protein